jgi:hypothetical protein
MGRRYDIDVLRVAAFAVLILYHLGMVYVAEWGFHFKSPHQWEWLQWPMVGVNRWRMSLIFLVSGLALGLARPQREPLAFGLRRSWRLLLPLSFGMVAIVPIQAYCEAVANGVVEPGLVAFMARYLQFRPWPEGGFSGAQHGITWNHLWFLAYLWVYTVFLVAVIGLWQWFRGERLGLAWLAPGRWPLPLLLFLPPVYVFAVLYWVAAHYSTTHALFDDVLSHARYLPVFIFGYLVARDERFWARIDRGRWAALGLAVLGVSVYMILRVAGRVMSPEALGDLPEWNWHAISRAAHALYMWTAMMAILAFAQRWLNRPYAWLPRANEAVYPWYILHQSLIVPLAFLLAPLGLPGGVEFTLVLAGTVAGCLLLHELLIRRVRFLRPLFGLKPIEGKAIAGAANADRQRTA